MRRLAGLVLAINLTLNDSVIAQQDPLQFGDVQNHFQLVRGLTEISGLAVASENSVYAHNDEHGIIYEIDLSSGAILTAFALGEPTVQADFEGIAVSGQRIYLVTSAGLVYESMIGAHRSRVRYNVFDTGAGESCEIEGLTSGPGAGEFLIICKTARQAALEDRLVLFKWNVNERLPVSEPWLDLELSQFLTRQERKYFRPSAIKWNKQNNNLTILSARSHLLVNLRQDGAILSKTDLAPKLHPQAEGVAIMPSGELVIADEGTLRTPGALTIYSTQE